MAVLCALTSVFSLASMFTPPIFAVIPLTGAVELMDDVLDSHEKDGLRPLKLNRLRRSDRLLLMIP